MDCWPKQLSSVDALDRRSWLLAGACFGLLGCRPTPRAAADDNGGIAEGNRVRIAAASDTRPALEAIRALFLARLPESSVDITYGASGILQAQLSAGAPFDLYLSADEQYPQKLIAEGLAERETLWLYGMGRLAIWAHRTLGLEPAQLGLKTLSQERVRHVALAQPLHAPYGRIAREALVHFGMWEMLQTKLVYAESVAQAAQMVESGAAQVGLLALSLASASPLREQGSHWLVPAEAHTPLRQMGVVMRASARQPMVLAFCELMKSEVGLAHLESHGLSPAEAL